MDEALTTMSDANKMTWARKLLTLGILLLALNESVAISPVPPPAIPPDIRLTIGLKELTVDAVLNVYRAFEQAATRANLTCDPTTKAYESWREQGFEPMTRTMVCSDSHTVLIDAKWVNVAPKSIDIDFSFGSQTEPSTKSRMQRLVRELEKSLKEDPSVTSLTRDTWSREQLK
jgi:hypothetical protein